MWVEGGCGVKVGESLLRYKCFSRRYLEWLPHFRLVKSSGSYAASQMSANETFIPSTIMYSAYATYDVEKLKLKLKERESTQWSGIKVLSALRWGAVPYKSKLNLLVVGFLSR